MSLVFVSVLLVFVLVLVLLVVVMNAVGSGLKLNWIGVIWLEMGIVGGANVKPINFYFFYDYYYYLF